MPEEQTDVLIYPPTCIQNPSPAPPALTLQSSKYLSIFFNSEIEILLYGVLALLLLDLYPAQSSRAALSVHTVLLQPVGAPLLEGKQFPLPFQQQLPPVGQDSPNAR